MDEKIIIRQFQEAWFSMDLENISACLSQDVRFMAVASENALNNKEDILKHAAKVFRNLKANNAVTIPGSIFTKDENSFDLVYCFDALVPEIEYMVNNEGIFMVTSLEPKTVSLETSISIETKGPKISKITISQRKIIECIKTAQHGNGFV